MGRVYCNIVEESLRVRYTCRCNITSFYNARKKNRDHEEYEDYYIAGWPEKEDVIKNYYSTEILLKSLPGGRVL